MVGDEKVFHCEEVTLKINGVLVICINFCDNFSSSEKQQQQEQQLENFPIKIHYVYGTARTF